MTLANKDIPAPHRVRMRALIVPREHGAWGLLLVPLFTGVAAGVASAHRFWPLLAFIIAAISLFWLRTPVESLLGAGPLRVHTSQERRTALIAAACLAGLSAACLFLLMGRTADLELLFLGAAAAAAFVVQAVLRKLGLMMRMTAQMVGAVGLTATAPAAYYIGTGHLDRRALILWAANWIFAGDQIHFVQLRIHAARAATFTEKFRRGWKFLLAQLVLLLVLLLVSLGRWAPPLLILAFVPALLRGTLWFFSGPEPLEIRSLGWSEMREGILFGVLLATAYVFP